MKRVFGNVISFNNRNLQSITNLLSNVSTIQQKSIIIKFLSSSYVFDFKI
jgi:hypothetical protein